VLLRSRIREGLPFTELTDEGVRAVASLVDEGLVAAEGAGAGRVVLTRRGRLLADTVVRTLTA
jgi:oxygen-independent coproporphyrinogen-3 oxidase